MKICIINAYILYKTIKKQNGQKPKTHLRFVKQLVDELIGSFRVKRIKKSCSSISEDRLNGKLHVMRRGTKKDCVASSKRIGNSGRRETTEYCDTCPNKIFFFFSKTEVYFSDVPTQKCHGVAALLSKRTLGVQRVNV